MVTGQLTLPMLPHLRIADNFPPELPTAAGESFSYHFGVDWFSAMFVPLGLDLFSAMQTSTVLLASVLPPILFFGYKRFVTNNRAAVFALLIFLLSGGTAAFFRFLFQDLPRRGHQFSSTCREVTHSTV